MNPNFRYAQAVMGHDDGRGAGLIESRHFIPNRHSIALLDVRLRGRSQISNVGCLVPRICDWMQSSANGKDEAKAKNNHGSWYAAQLACSPCSSAMTS